MARVLLSDLRMGQEPAYLFTFAVAERHSPPVAAGQARAGRAPARHRARPALAVAAHVGQPAAAAALTAAYGTYM